MPYKSDQQRKWAHTEAGKKALGGEEAVHEWDEATKGKKLPKYAKSEMNKFGGMGQLSLSEKLGSMQPKHPSTQKLYDFMAKCQMKKCGQ